VKFPRLLAVWFLILGTSFFFMPSAAATPPELMVRGVTILCANPAGETHTAMTGWNADNPFFNGKGDIARLFCEGGFIGEWTTYISDNYTGIGRYYNGIAPTPAPSPSPAPTLQDTVTASASPSPSETATPIASPSPSVETVTAPSPSPSPELSPQPSPTPTPSPSPSDTPTSVVETSTTIIDTVTVVIIPVVPQPTPEPTPIPAPVPVVQSEPTPTPVAQPAPQPAPEPPAVAPIVIPEPEPTPVPVEEPPAPLPEPVAEPASIPVEEVAPEPQPLPPLEEQPAPEPEPEPKPIPESAPEPVIDIAPKPPVVAAPDATDAEKEIVAQAIIEQAHGEPVTAQAIADAGLTYADLPPETPVEVRKDENGNEVVITAEVAAALVVLESPAALVAAIFTDPAQALLAIANIGADMSDEERVESEKIIIASVIAGQAAVNAAGMAGAAAYRRKP
jgi:hypothetical protein